MRSVWKHFVISRRLAPIIINTRHIRVKNPDNIESIVELEITKVQLRLLAFICKLTGGIPESEDILQNVNIKLWQQRNDYDATRPFFNWACTIAKYEVMTHRKTLSRSRLLFSDAFIEHMAERFASANDNANLRLAFLEQCRHELSGSLRQLIDWFYADRVPVAEIARRLKRNSGSVANSLYYARHLLRLCVEGKLATESQR